MTPLTFESTHCIGRTSDLLIHLMLLKRMGTNTSISSKKTLFFQMPNGTGKTTTLHLIRNILSGQLPSDFSEWRRSIGDDTNESFLNSPSEFELRLTINGEPYGFKLQLNHNTNEARFSTSTPKGIRQDWAPPLAFQKAFQNRPDLVQLFVFDAETARHITKRTDEKLLQQAIRQFGGFSTVYDLVGENLLMVLFLADVMDLEGVNQKGAWKTNRDGWRQSEGLGKCSWKSITQGKYSQRKQIKHLQTSKIQKRKEEIETRIS